MATIHVLPTSNSKQFSSTKKNPKANSLIDPSWELVDPTPDIHALFTVFNDRFFSGKIVGVTVQWGRFLSDAGRTTFRSRGFNWECKIFLSAPLLKLRPRADLINTLLHEMIHAFLFVTFNNNDRSDHGPQFHKHMYRINAEAGTTITVYHDFHDEVAHYKQHWWRCNGPCQKWKPRFGMLQRAVNRAPGPHDRWWGEHARSCGGTFIKVKEPEKPAPKRSKTVTKPSSEPSKDIRKYFHPAACVVSKSTPSCSTTLSSNVHTLKDVDSSAKDKGVRPQAGTPACIPAGEGRVLGGEPIDPGSLRTKWINKFDQQFGNSNEKDKPSSKVTNHIKNYTDQCGKLRKPTTATKASPKPHKRNLGTDHISPAKVPKLSDNTVACPVCDEKVPADKLNEHLDSCLSKEHFRECIICDASVPLANYEIHVSNCADKQITSKRTCTLCYKSIPEDDYNEHVDQCLQETTYNLDNMDKHGAHTECVACGEKILKSELNVHLEDCNGLSRIFEVENEPEEDNRNNNECICPVCSKVMSLEAICDHIDGCLEGRNARSSLSHLM